MFSKSLRDFFKNPVIVLPYILFTLVIELLTNLFTSPEILNKLETVTENSDPIEFLNAAGPFFLYLFILINLGIFLSPVFMGWVYAMSKDAVDGQKPGFSKGFKGSWKYYFRLLSSSVLMFLIPCSIISLFIVLGMPMAINLTYGESMAPIAGIVLLILLLMLILLLLFIIFLPLPIIVVYDNLNLDEGFRLSFKFGLKKFFHILGPLMLVFFIIVIISLPTGISQIMYGTASPVLSIITSLVTSYISLFIVVYVMNLYKEYRYGNMEIYPDDNSLKALDSDTKHEPLPKSDESTTDSENKEKEPDKKDNNFIV